MRTNEEVEGQMQIEEYPIPKIKETPHENISKREEKIALTKMKLTFGLRKWRNIHPED